MKKILLIGLFISGAAAATDENPFLQAERQRQAELEAQVPPDNNEDPDPPSAPINNLVPVLLLSGLGLAYIASRRLRAGEE
ncbi:MAG: hypothetical protein EAS48_05395 [Chryseobacterium sp.]|nr:MAG: hypothetical protein EAS48_05395 [Chryseobacterium sp.]